MTLRIWLAVLITGVFLTPVYAAEIKATSNIDSVTVYPSGARITRHAKVKVTKGSHVILLDDLAAQASPGSIRVEGRATGELEIGSVDSRRVNVATTDAAVIASERKRIEKQIEGLHDKSAAIQSETDAAQTQLTLIQNLTQLPVRPSVGPSGVAKSREDWAGILSLIAERMRPAQKVLLGNKVRQRIILRQIKDLQGKLATVAPNQKMRTQVKVHVIAAADLEVDLKIQYQVRRASWRPLYDARLATGGKTVLPALTLVRRATITQRTGEAWDKVRLELSTSQPAGGTAAPELYQLSVDFWQPRPPPSPRPMAMSAPPRARSLRRDKKEKLQNEADYSRATGLVQKVRARPQRAKVKIAPFQAVFEVPGRQTIAQTGEAKRVMIDQTSLEPSLLVRTVPKRRAVAFLYAKFLLPKGTPYLPGPVQLFRDSTFVGGGHLPLLRPGQDHELGFGRDDAVLVKFAVLEEKRGETGLISSSKTDKRNYKITVRNLHERAITLSVLDQIPVSKNQDIRVELNAKTSPTRRDVKDRRGVLAWEKTMRRGEEVVIEFGYRITWPSGKNIRYGR